MSATLTVHADDDGGIDFASLAQRVGTVYVRWTDELRAAAAAAPVVLAWLGTLNEPVSVRELRRTVRRLGPIPGREEAHHEVVLIHVAGEARPRWVDAERLREPL